MPVEKDKVLNYLKSKLKGGQTQAFKDKMAALFAEQIENDESIEQYVDERLIFMEEADKEATSRVNEALKKANSTKPEEPKTEELKPTDNNQKLLDAIEALTAKVTGFEQAQNAKTLEQRFKSDERLKDIPEVMFKGRIPAKEEDLEAAITELVTDYAPIAESIKTSAFGKFNTPGSSNSGAGKQKEASKEQLDVVLTKITK